MKFNTIMQAILFASLFVIILPFIAMADFKPNAQVGITNYSRYEKWSYICPENFNSIFSKYLNQVAGLFGYDVKVAESSISQCTGSGGLGSSLSYTYWNGASGGRVIESETTAPRYGSKTCTTQAFYGKTPNGFLHNAPLKYVYDSCSNKTYYYDNDCVKDSQCKTVLFYYGNFDNFVKEIGNGYSSVTRNLNSTLIRKMQFSVRTKMGLRFVVPDNNLYKATIRATASELQDYKKVGTATSRPLGWSEYTVAGKQVSKGRLFRHPYQVDVNGRNGEIVDITPMANFSLYFFKEKLISISEK